MILTLYFSGTGNTKYIAEQFSEKIDAKCLSIEEDANFTDEIKTHDTIAICYPIYGSRVPLIMREFVTQHMGALKGKKLAIFVTQLIFSGDGARVLCDLFLPNHVQVIYAEHFLMPNNVCNFALLRQTSDRRMQKQLKIADKKLNRICHDMSRSKIKKRGFGAFARFLGKFQGIPWQGDSRNSHAAPKTMEYKAKHGVKIHPECTSCGICVHHCPMKNLEQQGETITHKNNCTLCYRCINICPQKAITVFFHARPKWQYKGIATDYTD